MRSKRFRYSSHPLTRAIDTSIDARKAAGSPVTTGDVAGDLVTTVPAALMLTEFRRLVGGRVRSRLKARGEMVVDDTTWERMTDVDVSDVDFKTTIKIKSQNLKYVRDRLRADRDVEKFLDKQALRLGRSVTMGEFEAQIDAIYAATGSDDPAGPLRR